MVFAGAGAASAKTPAKHHLS